MQRSWMGRFLSAAALLLFVAQRRHGVWAQSICQAAGGGGAASSWPEHGETDPPHTDSILKVGHGNVRARLCVEEDADTVIAVIPWRQRRLINAWCALTIPSFSPDAFRTGDI